MLRARGLKVGGRKAELIDRLRGNPAVDVPTPKEATATMEDNPPTQFDGAIPIDGIVIEAGKSWGLFQRSAVALEAKIREMEPDVQVFGHPRGKGPKGWNPINLQDIPGESKTAPTGTFRVRLGGSHVDNQVFQIGPEQRPFPILRELDINDAAVSVVKALQEVREQNNM